MRNMKSSCYKGWGAFALVLSVFFLNMNIASAASSPAPHTVTAVVPSIISLTTSTPTLSLAFPDFISGSETLAVPATYQVKSNSLTTTGRVTLALSSAIVGMDFKADGQPYTKTSGTASLRRTGTVGTYVTVGTVPATMYNQQTDSGTGKISRGTFVINYKFTATADLDSGSYGPVTLTATLFDV